MRRRQWILAALLIVATATAWGLEVGGVQLADSVQLAPDAAPQPG